MKQLVLFLTVLSLPLLALSQDVRSSAGAEPGGKAPVKVMIIPFHPVRYYFSDCDKDLAKKSKMEQNEVATAMMAGLDYAAEQSVEKKYDPINLYQMKDSISKETLRKFYDNVSYAYDAPTRATAKGKKSVLQKMRDKMAEQGAKKKGSKMGDEECYTVLEEESDEYMKLQFTNQEFLEEMNALYTPDYYITINQMEVKTDYSKCIDRELGVFTRRIKVHYNVFTPDGKMVYGDVITAKYNSTSSDVNQIIMDNFGFLGDYIRESLPR
jgi:hypothetical protein